MIEIKKEQVDEAWRDELRFQLDPSCLDDRKGMFLLASTLGIIECEKCKGTGVYRAWDFNPNEKQHRGQTISACESCGGHKWVHDAKHGLAPLDHECHENGGSRAE